MEKVNVREKTSFHTISKKKKVSFSLKWKKIANGYLFVIAIDVINSMKLILMKSNCSRK